MTLRIMGDATHDNVPTLPATIQLAAGYVTGSPDIKWTTADWARFPSVPHVTIDQGFTGSPVPSATVRDVEPGAWTAANAVDKTHWTPDRPTIYCDRNDLQSVLDAGWQGDLWLAFPGWVEGQPLPAAPGCEFVAVQNVFAGSHDLSAVLDPYWPALPPPPDGHKRIEANGIATLAGIARRHNTTVHEIIAATVQHVRPGPFSHGQRVLLDHLADARPELGTEIWLP